MIFLSYVAFGALLSSLMMSLTFLNGLFFTIVTTLTIGFGDIVPVTPVQRFAVCFYAVFGIIILGAAVRLTTEAVVEGIQVGYRRRLQGYRKRRSERKRDRDQVRRWRAAIEKRLRELEIDVWTYDKSPSPAATHERPKPHHQGSISMMTNFLTPPMRLNTEALPIEALESAAREAGVPLEEFKGRTFRRRARHHGHRGGGVGVSDHHHHHHHHHRHHHRHLQDQSDQPQSEPQSPQQQGEHSTRVPLDFTWTIDDAAAQEPQTAGWCGDAWKRASRALRMDKSSESAVDAEPQPSPTLSTTTTMSMLKVVEREERRSLYIKVRRRFLGNNTIVNEFCFLDGVVMGLVPHLLDSE